MIDACRAAPCTWPTPTQPTLLTWCTSSNPVESVTRSISKACCLARLEGRCRVSLTVGIVCVLLGSPSLAYSYRTIVTHYNGNTRVVIIPCKMGKHMSNTYLLWHICTMVSIWQLYCYIKNVKLWSSTTTMREIRFSDNTYIFGSFVILKTRTVLFMSPAYFRIKSTLQRISFSSRLLWPSFRDARTFSV